MSKPTTLRLALLVLALGLVAAACGTTDDSGQEATTTTTVAAATTTTPSTTLNLPAETGAPSMIAQFS